MAAFNTLADPPQELREEVSAWCVARVYNTQSDVPDAMKRELMRRIVRNIAARVSVVGAVRAAQPSILAGDPMALVVAVCCSLASRERSGATAPE